MFLHALIPNICIYGYRVWKWRRFGWYWWVCLSIFAKVVSLVNWSFNRESKTYLCTSDKAGFLAIRSMTRINVGLTMSYVKLLLFSWKTYILSNKRNAPNRKLNHKFSSTVKLFMNIDIRYKYDKKFRSTINLRDYWTMTFWKGDYHLRPIVENGYKRIVKIASFY